MRRTLIAAALSMLATMTTVPPTHAAVTVESVDTGGPAAAAGLLAGDRLARIDGVAIVAVDDLRKVAESHRPGDTVPVTVERDGESVDLSLTFGARPEGGVSMGVRLAVSVDPVTEPPSGTVECLAWIDRTYRIEPLMRELGLDLSTPYASIRACVEHDTRRMSSANAVKYCDNVFKVHCSAIDLLTELAEAQVQRCERSIRGSLGLKLEQYASWRTCGQDEVFDRYSMRGEATDAERCRSALLDACGTNIDAAVGSDGVAAETRAFVECCGADALDATARGGGCGMIDDGFSRGPCRERPVCVNRLTGEWLNCPDLGR